MEKIGLSVFDIGEADHVAIALVHYGDAVRYAAAVFIEEALGATLHGGVYAVVGGHEVGCRLEVGVALFLVGRIGEAVGAATYVDMLRAAAVALIELAFFESAFDVFHNSFS